MTSQTALFLDLTLPIHLFQTSNRHLRRQIRLLVHLQRKLKKLVVLQERKEEKTLLEVLDLLEVWQVVLKAKKRMMARKSHLKVIARKEVHQTRRKRNWLHSTLP